MRKNFKLLGAVAVAGVVATTGSAFTASNDLQGKNVAGFGTATVTGAATTVINHTLTSDGTKIEFTELTFSTDLDSSHEVRAGFGTVADQSCVVTVIAGVGDTAKCTYTTQTATSGAGSFNVAVS